MNQGKPDRGWGTLTGGRGWKETQNKTDDIFGIVNQRQKKLRIYKQLKIATIGLSCNRISIDDILIVLQLVNCWDVCQVMKSKTNGIQFVIFHNICSLPRLFVWYDFFLVELVENY